MQEWIIKVKVQILEIKGENQHLQKTQMLHLKTTQILGLAVFLQYRMRVQ